MTVNLFIFLWQISESGLIEILEKVNQQTEKKTTVKVGLTYGTSCVFGINTMSNLFIYCLHFSSTDGGLWTQMMMMMITNYQMEPWNPSWMCFTGMQRHLWQTVIKRLQNSDIFDNSDKIHVYWFSGLSSPLPDQWHPLPIVLMMLTSDLNDKN